MADAVIVLVGTLCVVHTTRELLGLLSRTSQTRVAARRSSGQKLTLRLDRREGGRRSQDRRLRRDEVAVGASPSPSAVAAYSSWDALQRKLALP